MQLFIVGRFSGIGGAERSLMPLAKKLHRAGHDLTLLLVTPPENNLIFREFPGKVIIPSGASVWNKFQAVVQLNRAIASADIVVASSELTVTYITWLLSLWHRKLLVADVQAQLSGFINDNSNPLHHYLCRWIYPQISYIRCVSKGVAQDLELRFGVPTKNISVIYVPFDIDAIAQAAQSPISDAHYHIFSKPTIVAVGRLTNQKRFDIAIESFYFMSQKYKIDAHLLLLGDGELRPQLEQQVQALGLTEQVFLPGFVENPHAYIKRSQVLLLSSDFEGFGRVLVDALAVGCPTVATDCPAGPYEILEGGKWGLLTPIANPEAIADAIAQVLTNPQLAQQLHEKGLERAKAFETQVIAQQYQAFLNQALLHRPA